MYRAHRHHRLHRAFLSYSPSSRDFLSSLYRTSDGGRAGAPAAVHIVIILP